MLNTRRRNQRSLCWSETVPTGTPVAARPSATTPARSTGPTRAIAGGHPLTDSRTNARLADYEQGVRDAFERIVPTLKDIAALQHEADFEQQAQAIAGRQLGFKLPDQVLADAWIDQLDMRTLFAWSVFQSYRQLAHEFFQDNPLGGEDPDAFDRFLQECGFHTLDLTPCADGRLAHAVSYALRLPHERVRRKSYAGAMFDVEESVTLWVETELNRFREGKPNTADAPTRYLKVAMYHYSSVDPEHEGCAAHGSDERRAAEAALGRLLDFQQAIQNSFCCGASIDLLLIGLDTDTDAVRIHLPDADGNLEVDRFLDARHAYERTAGLTPAQAESEIEAMTVAHAQADVTSAPTEGMRRLIMRLIVNNLSQIDYVRQFHGGTYADVGHRERFIGVGTGFDEIQLRNLTYFAHLNTLEEGAPDLDVGIKIFSKLNVAHGLPIPVVVRFDYLGAVPGARDRAIARCRRVQQAIKSRYADLTERGLLHTLLAVRDCSGHQSIEIVGSSLPWGQLEEGHA
jgi:carboxysome shell carbonic anhydrase